MKTSRQRVNSLYTMEHEDIYLLTRKLGATTFVVLLRLFDERQRGDDKCFFLRQDGLSQDLSLPVRVVRREIKKLQDFGLIQVRNGGFGNPNRYRLNLHAVSKLFEDDNGEPEASHAVSPPSRRKDDPSDDHAAENTVTLRDYPKKKEPTPGKSDVIPSKTESKAPSHDAISKDSGIPSVDSEEELYNALDWMYHDSRNREFDPNIDNYPNFEDYYARAVKKLDGRTLERYRLNYRKFLKEYAVAQDGDSSNVDPKEELRNALYWMYYNPDCQDYDPHIYKFSTLKSYREWAVKELAAITLENYRLNYRRYLKENADAQDALCTRNDKPRKTTTMNAVTHDDFQDDSVQDERQAVIYWAFIHKFDYVDPDINGSDFATYYSNMNDITYERFRRDYYKEKKRHNSPIPEDSSINPFSPEKMKQAFEEAFDEDWDSTEGWEPFPSE